VPIILGTFNLVMKLVLKPLDDMRQPFFGERCLSKCVRVSVSAIILWNIPSQLMVKELPDYNSVGHCSNIHLPLLEPLQDVTDSTASS